MDPFREYYISSIVPHLKKIEDQREIIEKRIYRIAIIHILILTIIVVLLFIKTHNIKVVYIYFALPIPFTFFSKDLTKNYSMKYKETVIKNLFLSYFDDYVIDTERKSQLIKLKESWFISSKWKIKIDAEDFITVTFKGNHICVQEILFKQAGKVSFKGLLCSIELRNSNNQTFIINNQNNININKYIAVDDFKILNINNVNIFYQGTFDQKFASPFIDFVNNNHVSLSIKNDKLHCLFPSDRISIDDRLDMFEPFLTTKFNSNDTYRFIRDEYLRISKISRLLLKLEEINMA